MNRRQNTFVLYRDAQSKTCTK